MEKTAERLYSMKLGDVHETDHGVYTRTVGGWIFETKKGNEFLLPFNKEFKPVKKKEPTQGSLEIRDEATEKWIGYWNKQNIHKCIKATDELKKALKTAIKKHGKESIFTAIKNYSEVYHSDHYFNTSWSFLKFLKQGNCIPDFVEDGVKWVNYKKDTTTPEKEVGVVKVQGLFSK